MALVNKKKTKNKTLGLSTLNNKFRQEISELRTANQELATELKALQEKTGSYRAVVETANDAIMTVDSQGEVVFWNKGSETIFGYKEKEILKKSVFNLIPEPDKEKHKKGLEKMSETRFVNERTVEAVGLRKDGTLFPMESSRYCWNLGDDIFHTIIVRDVTTRKISEDKQKALNKELKENGQELMAVNQQLKASNMELMESESALRQSEKKYRELVETINEGLMVGDKDAYFTFVNNRLCEMTGYSKDKFIGQHTTWFLDKANKKIMLEQLNTRKRGIYKAYEIALTHKNGEQIYVIISPKPIFDETGIFQGSLAVITDITKLKKAENEIRAARDFLENIFRTTADGIIVTDSRGYLVRGNKAIENMLGFTERELVGKHTSELVPRSEEGINSGADLVNKLRKKGLVENYEVEWLRKDGELCPVELNVSFLKDKHGKPTGSVTMVRNIAERKKAEKELKETKDFTESVIESSVDGILICDEIGNIISVNSALAKMCVFSKEELIGKHASELVLKNKETIDNILEKTALLFEKGFTSYEAKYRNKDGKTLDVECISSMIKDEKGNNIAGVSIIRDISDRKKMEHQLLQSEKLRSLGELAGGVAHDFNNVLAAILGRAQLMKKQFKANGGIQVKNQSMKEIIKDLETIESAAVDGAETVRRIQEFSRRRKNDKHLGIADLKKVIEGAVEFTKVKWKNEAETKGVAYKISTELSSLKSLKGSTSELREVFINLINNSLDAMPEGGEIIITSSIEEHHIVIRVQDTGVGVSKAIIDKIFDPFFTTKGPKSTGLGMSVSYGIINRHNGSISVESIGGKGTTFIVRLPLSEKRKKRVFVKPALITSNKASILIVEDETGVRELLHDLLVCEGHEVVGVCNGNEAIELFKQRRFDIVFTDLGMPGISGWKVAEEIKHIDNKTPVILVTGWEVMHRKAEIDKSGVDMIINKPFQMNQILQGIKKGMELRGCSTE